MCACLQAYGDAGYGARVTHSANLAIHFEQRIKASGGAFVLSHPRSFVNVCFWWVPPALRPFQPRKASQQDLATLDKVGQGTICSAGLSYVQPAAGPQGVVVADFRCLTHAVCMCICLMPLGTN